MASTLLRTSALRESALRRAVAAAAADAPSGGKRLPAPLRRVSSHSGSSGVEPPSASSSHSDASGVGPLSHDEKVKLLNQRINELNSKVEKRYLLYASLQKLVEEEKMRSPFAEWSWQVGVVGLIVLAKGWMGLEKHDN